MPPQPGAMRNRWTAYAGLSTALAAGVILKSLAQRPNFYSAAVYLSQSSANLMILCNLVFVTTCTVLLFLQKLLYGPLRPIEVEQLYEKAWFAVTETCLAMTIFRGEIGAWFLVMFFSLLVGKVWGWIGEGRVEVLEQQQHNILAGRNARLFHTRLAASLILSVLFDAFMLDYVVGQVLHMARPDMMVMFGFEFAVLTITSMSTVTRYALNLVEIAIVRGQKQKRIDAIRKERVDAAVRSVQEPTTEGEQPAQDGTIDMVQRRSQAAAAAAQQNIDEADVEVEGWEGKGRWVFYLDLATDFCKLVIYLTFFFILLIFYGLPLHIMRDVFLTCRSFFKRIGDFMRYRNATRDMNQRYPDATEAEIGREDVCIICREEMRLYVPPAQGVPMDPVTERMRPKKLPCGHVLHFACLRSWLERQQICPTCRATVVPTTQTAQGGAVRAQGAAARAPHPQNGGNGRPRVFQLGPLRIGVGAGRGPDMLEQLEQQLGNLNPPPGQAPGDGPQQYGFGIRWDGMRPRRAHGTHRHVRGSVEDQLNAAERQIQREVDALQASTGELQALRNIQGQLARIRLARQATAAQMQQPVPGQTLPVPTLQVRQTITSLVPNQQQNVLQAGSDQLPQGVTLPDGWTMMPLQPLQAPQMPPPVGLPPFPMMGGMQTAPFMMPGAHGHLHQQQHMPLNAAATRGQATQHNVQQQQATPGQTTDDQTRSQQAADQVNAFLARTAQQASAASQPSQNGPATAGTAASTGPTSSANNLSQSRSSPQTPASRSSVVQLQARPPPSQTAANPTPFATSRPTPTNAISLPPSTASTSINAPQRLEPSIEARRLGSSANGVRTSSTPPHRPQKSIGSSWGFSGVEDDNTDKDSDEDDEKTADGESEDQKGKARKTNGNVSSLANGRPRSEENKNPTVEDLTNDPD